MDRRTEKSNFIGRCSTNIECPKREEIKKLEMELKEQEIIELINITTEKKFEELERQWHDLILS